MKSLLVLFSVTYLLPTLSMASQNYTRKPGYCMWYGQCGLSSTTKKPINCLYNDKAKNITDAESRKILSSLCPELVLDNEGVCCNLSQIQSLQSGIQSAQQMMARCPSCWKNFRQLYCLMTCSPNNSLFIDPIHLSADNKSIEQINYYVDPLFRQGLYSSCKNVLFPSSNKKIMSFLCGMAADKCDAMKFLRFMGNPAKNGQSPFLIQYPKNATDHPDIKPMNEHISLCNETVYQPNTNKTSAACSCQDCLISCQALPPYHPPKKWELDIGDIHFNLISFVTLVIYLFFLVIFIAGSILYFNLSSKRQRFEFENGMGYQKAQVGLKTHGCLEMLGKRMNKGIKVCFTRWGNICCDHPWIIICLSVLFIIACGVGLTKFTVITDPVKLWSSPDSQARKEKEMFDNNFSPFYRTAQIIFSIKSGSKYHNKPLCYTGSSGTCKLDGPILRKPFLLKILEVQSHLINMSVRFDNPERNSSHITLQDICMKPLSPYNNNCTVMSALQYWQNDVKKLNTCIPRYNGTRCADNGWNVVASWGDHLVACANNPTATDDATKLHLPCTSLFGGPVAPNIAFGGYNDSYIYAKDLIVTFVIENHVEDSKNDKAKAWEKEFLKYMKKYRDDDLEVAYMAERSIEDEIKRESYADVYTILISYLIMFLYITFALGQVNECDRFMIDSKISLAFGGILIVLGSVVCSLGIFSYANQPATLIIIEVVPFLVLAVGVDNIFILVQKYQRDVPRSGESISNQIGRVLGEIAPSMLLTSTSEAVAFAFGALSSMPAVKVFSLYAAVAVFCNFLLQLTCFVALLSLDVKRQQGERFDVCCWIKKPKKSERPNQHSILYQFFEKILSPALLSEFVRPCVIVFFTTLLALSIMVIPSIELGLDQSLSMPKDSYMITYFKKEAHDLKVGPPVYFVLNNPKFPYQLKKFQNKVCGSSGCDNDSLTQIAYNAYRRPEQSKIGMTLSSWLDDYFSWADPAGEYPCCRILDYTDKNGTRIPAKNGTFCNASLTESYYHCHSCLKHSQLGQRPNPAQFPKYLPYFLKDNPDINCPKGGHAAYASAVILNKNTSKTPVKISRFMGYHTILKNSNDYIDALKSARHLAKEMSEKTDSDVFAYSVFYVYYGQYLTIVRDSCVNLLVCLASIFAMTFILMGFHFRIAFIVTFTVAMIVTDIMGLMYVWSISLNAVSLVNLVMAVGISVEFCSHIARHFAVTPGVDRIERAKLALAHMGSSVFSGITLTKFGGILVLAFSHSQIFEVFYFRMYMGMVLFGASHGLLFLPVFLSYVGPDCRYDEETLIEHIANSNSVPSERSSLLGQNNGLYGSGPHTVPNVAIQETLPT